MPDDPTVTSPDDSTPTPGATGDGKPNQDELRRIAAKERDIGLRQGLKRGKSEALAELLSSLGLESEDDLHGLRETVEASREQLPAAQREISGYKSKLTKAEKELARYQERSAKMSKKAIESAIRAADAGRARDPEHLIWAMNQSHQLQWDPDSDLVLLNGADDPDALAEAVNKWFESNPDRQRPTASHPGSGSGPPNLHDSPGSGVPDGFTWGALEGLGKQR